MTGVTPAPSLGAHAVTQYRADLLGAGVVMAAPVTGWWAAQLVGPGPARAGLAAVVTIAFLAVGTGLFRSRAPRWNPLLMVADALLERRNSLSGPLFAGHILGQVGAAMAVAGVVVAGCFLAGITPPAVPAPGGVHAVSEMTAAAAAVICFFVAARTPTLRMSAAGASALAAAVFLVTGAGFLGNPAVVAGAVVLGLDPALALVLVVFQLGGCLIGYGVATAWWPNIGHRLDTLTT
ncbi:hypothetical protein IU510_06290 [Nocardia cyriacigeorgica]|uniref:hypothetical protein n=1 Tax=Nocardia cyriacigeorgica TaxID=135487 RepID=UPI00189627E9|nr:hypothetical protein [Nocardia cyriacigeorgica]MBF6097689.1 hypothetical protein [Nocardia cyriacigeorgica]MBF6512966.1 hypothetical protein [Nocardia cyriacigeorgica]